MAYCPRCGSALTGYVLYNPISMKMTPAVEVEVCFLQVCYDCESHNHDCHFVSKATFEMKADEGDHEAMTLEEYKAQE